MVWNTNKQKEEGTEQGLCISHRRVTSQRWLVTLSQAQKHCGEMWLQSITLVVICSATRIHAWMCSPPSSYHVIPAQMHASRWTSRSRHCLSTTVSSSQDLVVTNKSSSHTPVFIEFEGSQEIVVSISKDSKEKDKEKDDKSSGSSSSSSGKEKKEHKMMSAASAMTKKFFLPKALENSSPGDLLPISVYELYVPL